MGYKIACLPGDGIGPEVTDSVIEVLNAVAEKFQQSFEMSKYLIGGCAIDATGEPLPQETIDACNSADAVFLGAIGGPKWDDPNAKVRPEQGLLKLRSELGVFSNIRPLTVFPKLLDASPLKPELLKDVDFVVVRELTGGIYFGAKNRGEDFATDECRYSIQEVERITKVACEMAMQRRKILTSVDKANVLETSRLWRDVVSRYVAENYPEITLEHQLVDSCAMKLIQNPSHFDVILTENMFGDILSDEASVLAGSMGLLASSSLGQGVGLFEPIHGSAPDIAGQGIANPYASILSAAMMLRWLNLTKEADAVENAVQQAIANDVLTRDLDATSSVTTKDATLAVIEYL
ncbi:3-isopropylmalate dehydrogenase [Aliikangiella coralliicola]|uniref:3-isopropylmalate dehydrogenase n=1 Tax=Aliikangiella coralliicola TaxID=2592383 RepID=A0A545UK57_9GAMM|nr:3-isopropylmalate dehydrogenase [Aliikangiella coralliicola]TQV89844.1 3-isopropylmalate dehydrogenase [Aliikangiella coralliicola]